MMNLFLLANNAGEYCTGLSRFEIIMEVRRIYKKAWEARPKPFLHEGRGEVLMSFLYSDYDNKYARQRYENLSHC